MVNMQARSSHDLSQDDRRLRVKGDKTRENGGMKQRDKVYRFMGKTAYEELH